MNPKYEDQYSALLDYVLYRAYSDDNNSICPYCGKHYQVEAEDYDEAPHEIECESCGQKYWLVQQISICHRTTPDCELNRESHVFVTYGGGYFCSVCNKYQAKR